MFNAKIIQRITYTGLVASFVFIVMAWLDVYEGNVPYNINESIPLYVVNAFMLGAILEMFLLLIKDKKEAH